MNDKRLLVLNDDDNICVACTSIDAGTSLMIEGREVRLDRPAPTGFKIARRPIALGETVLKYGAPIGSATADIAPGRLVHTDNLRSDYIESHTLDDARRRAGEQRS